MAKKIHGLLEKYSKYCPRCKTYQTGVWQECSVCKTPLVDAKRAYKRHRLIKLVKNILVISLFIFATYGVQPTERQYYNKSIGFFVRGKFYDSKEEFSRAFSANPLYKFAKSGFQNIKDKITNRHVVIEIK